MGKSKKRVKKHKRKPDSIGGKGTKGMLRSFHAPKDDLSVRNRKRYAEPDRGNVYRDD